MVRTAGYAGYAAVFRTCLSPAAPPAGGATGGQKLPCEGRRASRGMMVRPKRGFYVVLQQIPEPRTHGILESEMQCDGIS